MSTPNRTIPVPTSTAREPRASRLVTGPASKPAAPAEVPEPVAPKPTPPQTVRINAQVPIDVRDRAHTAYRLATFKEGTPSFSAFVTGALEREINRLEQEHNDGESLPGDSTPMRTGRPPGQ